MKNLTSGLCHHDTPIQFENNGSDEVGAEIRQRAAEACGFRMGQDLFASHAEMIRNGGPEAIVRRAVRRAQKEHR